MNYYRMSREAQAVVKAMVEYALSHGVCMGMEEGLADDGSSLPLRAELEAFAGVENPVGLLPAADDLKKLLISLKPQIMDDYRPPEGGPPGFDVTIGWTPDGGGWGWQTGDNSFTGGAYLHPVWAVVWLTRRANTDELVADIISQLREGKEV